MRTNRHRFSLRFLFIAVTALVLVLGVSQWRRHRVRHEIARLEAKGAAMGEREGWRDLIWMRAPEEAGVPFHEVDQQMCKIGEKTYDVRDAVAYAHEIEAELREFGVERVIYPFISKQSGILVVASPDEIAKLIAQ